MNKPPRFALALPTALVMMLGAAGCLPIPHTVTIAPAIDGRFMDDDRRTGLKQRREDAEKATAALYISASLLEALVMDPGRPPRVPSPEAS